MLFRLALAGLLLAGCGGQLETPAELPDAIGAADAEPPNACGVPTFAPEECEVVHLDQVTGPLDHQTICRRGLERWILNPDGDQWHFLDAADGGRPVVLCHGLSGGGAWITQPDGAVVWRQDGG